MIATFIIACVVGAANIFCFFAPALSYTPEYFPNQYGSQVDVTKYTMFNYIFGLKERKNGYIYEYIKTTPGMSLLFAFHIFIIILAILGLVLLIAYKRNRISNKFISILSVVGIAFTALSALLAYSTPMILKVNSYDYTWGFGPIVYCILQIFVIILFAGVLYRYHTDKVYAEATKAANKQNKPGSRPHRTSREIRNEQIEHSKQDDKVDLILEYKRMYDNGEISEEEYNKKKDELL